MERNKKRARTHTPAFEKRRERERVREEKRERERKWFFSYLVAPRKSGKEEEEEEEKMFSPSSRRFCVIFRGVN